jgi:hypothetical protein
MPHDPFTEDQLLKAWLVSRGRCECCGKTLTNDNRGRESGKGSWEAHKAKGRDMPVILCTGEPESCHLNCGHNGDFQNEGVVPKQHKARRYEDF